MSETDLDLEARWTAARTLAEENDRLRLQVDLKRKTIERLTRLVEAVGDVVGQDVHHGNDPETLVRAVRFLTDRAQLRAAFRAGFAMHVDPMDTEEEAWATWRSTVKDELL